MRSREAAFLRHQKMRWMQPDGQRWIRQDAKRYLKPDANVTELFPLLDRKYNQDQPRVPAGNGRESGRWTDGSSGSGGVNDVAQPMGSIDFDDLPNFSDIFALFQITPPVFDNTGNVQLAGDLPSGDNTGPPSNEPPEIPQERPKTSTERNDFLRAASDWLVRNGGFAGEIYAGAINNVGWLQEYHGLIQSNRDPPKTFEELQAGVGLGRPGYDDHHIVEQSWGQWLGLSQDEIDDPSNVVSIPRLKHYEISGWYSRLNDEFGGLSPREYLKDKSLEEARQIGLQQLIARGILKP